MNHSVGAEETLINGKESGLRDLGSDAVIGYPQSQIHIFYRAHHFCL